MCWNLFSCEALFYSFFQHHPRSQLSRNSGSFYIFSKCKKLLAYRIKMWNSLECYANWWTTSTHLGMQKNALDALMWCIFPFHVIDVAQIGLCDITGEGQKLIFFKNGCHYWISHGQISLNAKFRLFISISWLSIAFGPICPNLDMWRHRGGANIENFQKWVPLLNFPWPN